MKTKTTKNTWPYYFMMALVLFFVSCDDGDSGASTDSAEFAAEIATVTTLLSTTEEGNDVGDYILGSKTALQEALTTAEALAASEDATQDAIDDGLIDLEDARFEFEAQDVEDASLLFSSGDKEETVAVEQSANSAELFNLGAFTFETWVYYTDKPGFFGQMASTEFYADGVWGWNVRIGDGDALDFSIGDDEGESRLQPDVEAVPAAIVPRNEWVHIACTFDGTTMTSYINGVEIGSIDASERTKMDQVASQEGAEPLTLGNSAGFKQPERRLVGRMFDVRYWNVARSAADIAAHKDFIITGTEEGLVAYWPFAKATATDLVTDNAGDVSGENNLLLTDGALVSTRN